MDDESSAKVNSAESTACSGESGARWPLSAAGIALIIVGVTEGPGLLLFAWLRQLGWDCWWLLASLVLFIGLYGTRMQRGGRLAGAALSLIWLVIRRHDLPYLVELTFARLGESPLGPMLIVLGGLLLVTNLPGGRLREMWTATEGFVIRRRCVTWLLCGATLWVAHPEHSHELCLNGAEFCAERGYFRPAIALTELARDTFPPPNFCGNCLAAEQEELSARMSQLKARAAGYRGDRPIAQGASPKEPPSLKPRR
jgi:hypothetical protein